MNIGHRLREFRLRFNYTVEDLSSLINVTSETILSWEKGEVTPNFEQLNELAALYDVSEEDLINTNKGINECYGDFDQDRKVDDEEVKNKSKVNKEKDIKSSKIKFKAKLEILRNLDTIFVILFVAIYLILGFTVSHGWAAYWPLILLGFVPSSIIKAIIYKKSTLVNYTVLWIGIYLLVSMIGTAYNLFNIWWCFIFAILLIILSYSLANILDVKLFLKRKNKK